MITKNRLFSSLFAIGLLAVTGIGVSKSMNNYSDFSILSLKNIEAIASNETSCISRSSDNNGTCKKRADGYGDVCVKGGFWDTKNCYTHAVI